MRIYLLLDNIRSTHNVGALLRTAEGLGVAEVILGGYTPYPKIANDPRPPFLADKIERQIHKTALGAERSLRWSRSQTSLTRINSIKRTGVKVVALEQTAAATKLTDYRPTGYTLLVVGNEVDGIGPEILAACDAVVQIPMHGDKESFNVSVAGAMALFYLTLMV